jgi:hypothetical protein
VNRSLAQIQDRTLLDDPTTCRKLSLNLRRNREQDHTAAIDQAALAFRYDDCRQEYWQDRGYSLLHGTPLWDGADAAQRVVLNQLYWVAYYAQIISAEIATILLNQTSAAGLSTLEDFRTVCDTLDLETSQERAHIAAFKTVGEAVEASLFGARLFTYPMRSMYTETMLFHAASRARTFWRRIQIGAFSLLSSGNAFIGCQYFTVRGLRTLNGKMIQHGLAQLYQAAPDPERAPAPARISHAHFMDESYHFNSSCIISRDVLRSLRPPTPFERWVANRAIRGCQRDHFHFSVAVRGIFWYDPALFSTVYRLLRSAVFAMGDRDAREMVRRCFTEESEGLHDSHRLHQTAVDSYRAYLAPLDYVDAGNRAMSLMRRSTLAGYLRETRRAFATWVPPGCEVGTAVHPRDHAIRE